jgi:hypothetical protein
MFTVHPQKIDITNMVFLKSEDGEVQDYRIKQNLQGAVNFATGMALSLV